MRTEFGIERIGCDCKECLAACQTMPGYLIPSDLTRLAKDPIYQWARLHLLASPGALVATKEGEMFRIPTLVPRKSFWGTCHWLVQGKCTVWENSPFGCAMFRVCTPVPQEDLLVNKGLIEVHEAHENRTLYSIIWEILWNEGIRAQAPEEGRSSLSERLET